MDTTLSIEDKIALAERAASVGIDELGTFCDEQGLPLADVTSWSTAWETGGRLGVQALVVHSRSTADQARRWKEEVRVGTKLFRPRLLRVLEDGNHFTIEVVKPLTAKQVIYTPWFQLRVVTEADGAERWFLFWRRASGEFWPYAGRTVFRSATEAAAEVQRDPHRCFRLHPGT